MTRGLRSISRHGRGCGRPRNPCEGARDHGRAGDRYGPRPHLLAAAPFLPMIRPISTSPTNIIAQLLGSGTGVVGVTGVTGVTGGADGVRIGGTINPPPLGGVIAGNPPGGPPGIGIWAGTISGGATALNSGVAATEGTKAGGGDGAPTMFASVAGAAGRTFASARSCGAAARLGLSDANSPAGRSPGDRAASMAATVLNVVTPWAAASSIASFKAGRDQLTSANAVAMDKIATLATFRGFVAAPAIVARKVTTE